jgi:hypothetical protein
VTVSIGSQQAAELAARLKTLSGTT